MGQCGIHCYKCDASVIFKGRVLIRYWRSVEGAGEKGQADGISRYPGVCNTHVKMHETKAEKILRCPARRVPELRNSSYEETLRELE